MSIIYVQFSDASETAIAAVFGCGQDPDAYPNQGQIEDTDPRYLALLNPARPPKTNFSSLEYLSKFAPEEYASARTGPIPVQFGLDMLIAAQFVDLNDPRVGMTLDLLVSEDVITPERKAELLTPQAA